jgi:5-methylcytosine-specific restriction enzyme subunit McrC
VHRVCITEYERIYFSDEPGKLLKDDSDRYLPRHLLEKLRSFDEMQRKTGKLTVFDWSARDYAKATSMVGVVQIPGLTVEILPKIASVDSPDLGITRSNLLYMLSLTRKLPITERDIACLGQQKMNLLEALIRLFAMRLMNELRRGIDHAYLYREENLPRVKGKILINRHLIKNAAHQERFYVGFDEFLEDTLLNRILKATSRRLISMSSVYATQRVLMEAAAVFDEVEDIIPSEHHFEQIHLHRNNERFCMLLDFCRMVWQGNSPNPATGLHKSFSILFPMEKLFEEFIANYIYQNASELELNRSEIAIQSIGCRKYLTKSNGKKMFQLKPDLILKDGVDKFRLVLDTKWKCLKSDVEDRKNGVSQADMYQMYAYAKQYDCENVVLLYPKNGEAIEKDYAVSGDESKNIRVKTIDLSGDLKMNPNGLKANIKNILAVGSQGGDK